jgi:membrane protease YdiL (CAAX protease family)
MSYTDKPLAPLPPPEPAPSPPPPTRRGQAWLAWIVIVAACVFVAWRAARSSKAREEDNASFMMEVQARFLVGMAEISKNSGKEAYAQLRDLNRGQYGQRLRYIVLAGELAGPDEAIKLLQQLEEDRREGKWKTEPPQALRDAAATLLRINEARRTDPHALSITADERELLHRELGWYGDLAVAPPDTPDTAARAALLGPARRSVAMFLGFFALMGLAGIVGLCLFIVWLTLAATRRLRLHLYAEPMYGGIYAETFAIWLLLFIGLGIGASHLAREPGLARLDYLLSSVAMLLSLTALAWPRLRGVPVSRMREDVGLNLGGAGRNVLAGIGCYLAALPMLGLGMAIMTGLMWLRKQLTGDTTAPSHPAAGAIVFGDWWQRIQVLFAAAVVAPIAEETMFRGVLYRHLRETTARWGRFLSIMAGAVVTSFVFAAVHPQGWLGIPALMALAMAFTLAREWRSSLLPSMVAHGLNNGLVFVLQVLL